MLTASYNVEGVLALRAGVTRIGRLHGCTNTCCEISAPLVYGGVQTCASLVHDAMHCQNGGAQFLVKKKDTANLNQ